MDLSRFACCLLFLFIPTGAHGNLQPAEVAVLANGASKQSLALAKYYAKQREIPSANICSIDLPLKDVLPRNEWDRNVRPAIRKWLSAKGREKIRCVVTTWDVPLKIGKANLEQTGIAAQLQIMAAEKNRRLELSRLLTAELKKVAGGASSPTEDTNDSTTEQSPLERARAGFNTALAAAQTRVGKLPDRATRQQETQKIQQIVTTGMGLNALSGALERLVDSNEDARVAYQQQLSALGGRIQGLSEARAMIESTPLTLEHHQLALGIIDRTNGVFDSVTWIDGRTKKLRSNETNASFDNELACVLWPSYNLLLWQPNYLNQRFDGSPLRDVFPTIMVARIDAPTLPLCKAMIDTSLEVEKSGLKGKFYLDGRGLVKPGQAPPAPGSYADYDLALQTTADDFSESEGLELVYQNDPELFQPGECPDAALYCGWYSVAKYVDAFEWNPGSVAYHMASYELRYLRKPESQEWCKRMLEEGVCATIGAVQEPYLNAFPRPNHFFPLLLAGEKTLVECYYATNPFCSWAMALVGDPLYKPFRKQP